MNSVKYLLLALITQFSCVAQSTRGECVEDETIEYQDVRYNKLVCEGALMQEGGQIDSAIVIFEEALQENLFEEPNVLLYSRLSYLYSNVGNSNKAQEMLYKAQISLEVLFGIARCDLEINDSPDIDLELAYDRGEVGIFKGAQRLSSMYAKEIFFEMCQENIVHYYPDHADLESIVNDPTFQRYSLAHGVLSRASPDVHDPR